MPKRFVIAISALAGCLLIGALIEKSSIGEDRKDEGSGTLPGKFVHVAFYSFKSNAPEGTSTRFAEEAANCFAEIESVRGFQVGPPAKRGTPAEYSVTPAGDFQIGVVLCFDNFAGLAKYGNHPKHNELKKKYASLFEKIVTYDIESK